MAQVGGVQSFLGSAQAETGDCEAALGSLVLGVRAAVAFQLRFDVRRDLERVLALLDRSLRGGEGFDGTTQGGHFQRAPDCGLDCPG